MRWRCPSTRAEKNPASESTQIIVRRHHEDSCPLRSQIWDQGDVVLVQLAGDLPGRESENNASRRQDDSRSNVRRWDNKHKHGSWTSESKGLKINKAARHPVSVRRGDVRGGWQQATAAIIPPP